MPDNDETTVSKALKAALISIETLKGNSFNHLPLIDFQHLKGTEPRNMPNCCKILRPKPFLILS